MKKKLKLCVVLCFVFSTIYLICVIQVNEVFAYDHLQRINSTTTYEGTGGDYSLVFMLRQLFVLTKEKVTYDMNVDSTLINNDYFELRAVESVSALNTLQKDKIMLGIEDRLYSQNKTLSMSSQALDMNLKDKINSEISKSHRQPKKNEIKENKAVVFKIVKTSDYIKETLYFVGTLIVSFGIGLFVLYKLKKDFEDFD